MNFAKIILISSLCALISCTPKGDGILGSASTASQVIDNVTQQAPFAYDIAADTISYNSCTNLTSDQTPAGLPAFKIGVNEGFVTSNGSGAVKGGLKLKTDFLVYLGRFLRAQAPSATITPAQIQRVLANSELNAKAALQFSVRQKNNLDLVIDLINPNRSLQTLTPNPARDVALVQPELDSGFVANLLTKDIKFTVAGTVLSESARNYNLSENSDANVLQGSFGFNQTADASFQPPSDTTNLNQEVKFGVGEFYADSIRKKFNSNAADKIMLVASFGGRAAPVAPGQTSTEETVSQLRRPKDSKGVTTTDLSKAFGRGYKLKFEPVVTNLAGWASNIMTGVTEIDLSTGDEVTGGTTTWSCDRFVIVKSSQFNNRKLTEPTCSELQADDLVVSGTVGLARQQLVKKIRRQYSKDELDIGLFIPADTDLGATVALRKAKRNSLSLCVSLRNSSCYLPTTGFMDAFENRNTDIGIQYDSSKECYLTAYTGMGFTYTDKATEDAKRLLGRCAQYLSVCTRQTSNF